MWKSEENDPSPKKVIGVTNGFYENNPLFYSETLYRDGNGYFIRGVMGKEFREMWEADPNPSMHNCANFLLLDGDKRVTAHEAERWGLRYGLFIANL